MTEVPNALLSGIVGSRAYGLDTTEGILVTRDLTQRLNEMAAKLKHGEPEDIAKWETQDQIRSLLREAAVMIGLCSALLGPDELNLKQADGGVEVTIRTILDPAEVEQLIPLFAEHA